MVVYSSAQGASMADAAEIRVIVFEDHEGNSAAMRDALEILGVLQVLHIASMAEYEQHLPEYGGYTHAFIDGALGPDAYESSHGKKIATTLHALHPDMVLISNSAGREQMPHTSHDLGKVMNPESVGKALGLR